MPATAAQLGLTGVGFGDFRPQRDLHNRLLQRANLLLTVRAKTKSFRFQRAKHSKNECPDDSNSGQAQQYDDRPARKPRNFFSGYAHQSPITTLQAGDIITVLSEISQVPTDTIWNGCLNVCHKWLVPSRKVGNCLNCEVARESGTVNAVQQKRIIVATGVSSSTTRILALSLINQMIPRRTSGGFSKIFGVF